jgi:hypothetical protein
MKRMASPLDEPGQQLSWKIILTILCAIVGALIVLCLFGCRAPETKRAAIASAADWIWEPNWQTLEKVPPMFLLRPTKFPTNYLPFEIYGKDRYLARGKTVKQLMADVYSQKDSAAELVFVAPLPDGKYDCILTLQPQAKWWHTLESEIDKRFHVVAQCEQRAGKKTYVFRSAD